MSLFDSVHNNYQNSFTKCDPSILQSLFGATDLLPLWIADMDFKVCQDITLELQRLVDRGIYAYEFHNDAVCKAISDWNLKRHHNLCA